MDHDSWSISSSEHLLANQTGLDRPWNRPGAVWTVLGAMNQTLTSRSLIRGEAYVLFDNFKLLLVHFLVTLLMRHSLYQLICSEMQIKMVLLQAPS